MRLQPALSKPNGQSRRPHKPSMYFMQLMYLMYFVLLSEPLSPCRVLGHHACHHSHDYVSTEKNPRKKAHVPYMNVRKNMLDRRRPTSSSPTPPARSSPSSPHDSCKQCGHSIKVFDSLAYTSCQTLPFLVLPPSRPMIPMPCLPLFS